MRITAFCLILFFLLTSCESSSNENIGYTPFEVGAAMIDITPPIGFPRYGYPPVTSTGVLDSLYAKAFVFKQGEVKGALVICNLLAIPRDLSRIVRERASKETGIPYDNISITATHTHTSPSITEDFKQYALRESAGNLTAEDKNSYFTKLIEGVTRSIILADSRTVESEITSGKGEALGISFNRRYLMTDGRVRFNPGYSNQSILKPAGVTDPEVSFVLFGQAGQNSYSSSLTAFSSHYVRDDTRFSADYPHFIQERLNELFGNEHISIFGLGPCGDVNTVNPFDTKPRDIDEKVKEVGYTLADAVNSAISKASKNSGSLEIVSKMLYLPMQDYTEEELVWSRQEGEQLYNERPFLNHRRRLKLSVWGVQPPLEQLRIHEAVPPAVSGDPWRLPVEIHVFKLTPETVIVTMPGELFVEFGIDLKKRSPFANTILIELANSDIAYIPTIKGFQQGDYEAINSRLVPGAGEEMVNEALEILEALAF